MNWAEQLRASIRETAGDPRRLALVAILALVVSIQIYFTVDEWAVESGAAAGALRIERYRAAALAEAARDESVANAAQNAMRAARGWSHGGATYSIARLRAHQTLEQALKDAGVNATLRAEGDVEGAERVRFATFVVEGVFDWPSFLAFVEALAAKPEAASIEGFAVAPGATRRFRLIVKTPLVEGASAPAVATEPAAEDEAAT
jgi:hypothetical protein